MRVFMPWALQRLSDGVEKNQRFVHYTSAAVAASIIQRREIWLRNSQFMNDYSEIRHGIETLKAAYQGAAGDSFRKFLDSIHAGFSENFANEFNLYLRQIELGTYVVCLSEHDADEDTSGRLSMWRAYGGNCGVAIVLKVGSLFRASPDGFNVFSTPVFYGNDIEFQGEFEKFVGGLVENVDYLKELGRERLQQSLFQSFHFVVIATKNKAFQEEREWRVVHSPTLFPSDHVSKIVENCRGEPQIIYKLPLTSKSHDLQIGLGLGEILDKIIIGPCENPLAIWEALVHLLNEEGIEDAEQKVFASNIPIRKKSFIHF